MSDEPDLNNRYGVVHIFYSCVGKGELTDGHIDVASNDHSHHPRPGTVLLREGTPRVSFGHGVVESQPLL